MKTFLKRAIRSVIQSQCFDGQLNSLSTDESTIEYIIDLLSDLEISKEEKQETIQGILELHLVPSSHQPAIDDLHQSATGSTSTSQPAAKADEDGTTPKTIEELVKELIERADRYLSTRGDEGSGSDTTTSAGSCSHSRGSSISSTRKREIEEEERIKALERKKAIINNYGKVEVDQQDISLHPKEDNSQPGSRTNKASAPDDIHQLQIDTLDQELKLLDMKKRQRKKLESKKYTNPDEILLRPNLNTKIVEHEERLKKQELSMKNRMKMEKDKADLTKQKENQLKKKIEARTKAKKLERRA